MPTVIDTRGPLADDPWRRPPEGEPIPATGALLLSPAEWTDGRLAVARSAGRTAANGLWLAPDADLEQVAPILTQAALVAVHFPSATEGRGFSIAVVLRRRLGWRGLLRATGPLWRDQLFALRRVGFDQFELREGEDPAQALAAFTTFSDAYQTSVDGLAPRALSRFAAEQT